MTQARGPSRSRRAIARSDAAIAFANQVLAQIELFSDSEGKYEIGQVYGVTRERIRQIESKTMSKLRHPSRSQVLRDYLD